MDDIHEYLLLKGVEAVAIHGDKGEHIKFYFLLFYFIFLLEVGVSSGAVAHPSRTYHATAI